MSTRPRWWLDERVHAGAEHLDAEYVAGYERKAGYDPTEDVDALRAAGCDEHSLVVDLGAGTGRFAVAAAAVFRHVVAVDVSPAMTAMLRERVAAAGRANVDVVEGGFVSYEHAAEPADAVFTRNALHQIPDFWKGIALARIASVLRPGGVLRLHDLVYDFEPADASVALEAWMAGAVDDPTIGFTAAELADHVRGEHSTYRWLLEPLLDHTGFDIVEVSFRRGAYGAYTCRRRAPGV